MNKKFRSMQWRFTFLVGVLMLLIIGMISALSIFNAKRQFTNLADVIKPQTSLIVEESQNSQMSGGSIISSESADINEVQLSLTSIEKDYTDNTLFIMFLFALFSMVVTYFLVGHMLKPLKSFEKTIQTVSENNFSEILWTESEIRQDEIGRLQMAFQEMSHRLESAFVKQKRFSLDAAHELKTPVAIIKTGIQVLDLEKEENIEEYRDTLRVISKNVDRLSKIIDDLLCFSNNEKLPFETIELSHLIESVIQELQFITEQSGIIFDTKLEKVSVLAHATLLHRALFNIVENAIKYNQPNGQIWITTKKQGGEVEVTVRNTGEPIPKEELSQIFEPFYQVDPSRSKKVSGHGLGLALTKEIIEKHHGSVVAYTKENTNCFYIKIPIDSKKNTAL